MDLSETGSWTYWKLVQGPIRNWFVDILETSLWSYWKPVHGPIRNRFVDLSETGLLTYWKPVCAQRQKVSLVLWSTANLTKSNKNLWWRQYIILTWQNQFWRHHALVGTFMVATVLFSGKAYWDGISQFWHVEGEDTFKFNYVVQTILYVFHHFYLWMGNILGVWGWYLSIFVNKRRGATIPKPRHSPTFHLWYTVNGNWGGIIPAE